MDHDEDIEVTTVRPTVAIVGGSRNGIGQLLAIAAMSAGFDFARSGPRSYGPIDVLAPTPRREARRDRVIQIGHNPQKTYFESEVPMTKRQRRRIRGKRA
jgi:ornithine carbamoyltransferase